MVKNGQKWLNIQFFAIFHCLCLGMGNLFAPSLLSLTLDAAAMISIMKKLLQAITTPFFGLLPDSSIFGYF